MRAWFENISSLLCPAGKATGACRCLRVCVCLLVCALTQAAEGVAFNNVAMLSPQGFLYCSGTPQKISSAKGILE